MFIGRGILEIFAERHIFTSLIVSKTSSYTVSFNFSDVARGRERTARLWKALFDGVITCYVSRF